METLQRTMCPRNTRKLTFYGIIKFVFAQKHAQTIVSLSKYLKNVLVKNVSSTYELQVIQCRRVLQIFKKKNSSQINIFLYQTIFIDYIGIFQCLYYVCTCE